MQTYTTQQGQTWDQISKEVYGSELHIGELMESNQKLIDIFVVFCRHGAYRAGTNRRYYESATVEEGIRWQPERMCAGHMCTQSMRDRTSPN
ncbi:MAG: hypothetical protein ACLR78_14160 [Roseburia sp.]